MCAGMDSCVKLRRTAARPCELQLSGAPPRGRAARCCRCLWAPGVAGIRRCPSPCSGKAVAQAKAGARRPPAPCVPKFRTECIVTIIITHMLTIGQLPSTECWHACTCCRVNAPQVNAEGSAARRVFCSACDPVSFTLSSAVYWRWQNLGGLLDCQFLLLHAANCTRPRMEKGMTCLGTLCLAHVKITHMHTIGQFSSTECWHMLALAAVSMPPSVCRGQCCMESV